MAESKRFFIPLACPECLFGEPRRGMVYCRLYRESTLLDYDKRPDYCRVEKIMIEEGGNVPEQ